VARGSGKSQQVLRGRTEQGERVWARARRRAWERPVGPSREFAKWRRDESVSRGCCSGRRRRELQGRGRDGCPRRRPSRSGRRAARVVRACGRLGQRPDLGFLQGGGGRWCRGAGVQASGGREWRWRSRSYWRWRWGQAQDRQWPFLQAFGAFFRVAIFGVRNGSQAEVAVPARRPSQG
jgi:hypothetical protein